MLSVDLEFYLQFTANGKMRPLAECVSIMFLGSCFVVTEIRLVSMLSNRNFHFGTLNLIGTHSDFDSSLCTYFVTRKCIYMYTTERDLFD